MSANVTMNQGALGGSFEFTFKAPASFTASDVGKAVELDATAANTVKLATDDAPILGILTQVSDLSSQGLGVLATVSLHHGLKYTVAANTSVEVGALLVGAGDGKAKATDSAPAGYALPRVMEVLTAPTADADGEVVAYL